MFTEHSVLIVACFGFKQFLFMVLGSRTNEKPLDRPVPDDGMTH